MWIHKLNISNDKWTGIVKAMCPKLICIDQLGSNLLFDQQGTTNKFWLDVLKAYREFGKSVCSENTEELMAEPIFCNDNVKIGNRTVFYKSWIDKGIYNIGNTMCANGNFLSFEQFKDRYKNTDFITDTG